LKIDALQKALESYKLPELPAPQHDPESLTEEELHYLKRLGYKHKNYMILGVRGVFGGVVLNMHLHWKKHQLVKIRCKNFTKEEIDETGKQLARLSGGIVVDVQHGSTIVMYRGRNYTRPVEMTPKNTLSKRKVRKFIFLICFVTDMWDLR
jgi:RNA-binding protein YhbY